jgi:hypothetical protein
MREENPKFEARNPKEILRARSKTCRSVGVVIESLMFLICCFKFRGLIPTKGLAGRTGRRSHDHDNMLINTPALT